MPGRKNHNLLKAYFHGFTLTVRLSPSGIFGVGVEGELVLPALTEGIDEDRLNVDFLFSPEAASKPDPEGLASRGEFNGISFELKGDVLALRVDSLQPPMAYEELRHVLGRTLRELILRTGQPIRYQIISFRDETGTEFLLDEVLAKSVSFYDAAVMSQAFSESLASLTIRDENLDLALQYFESGCRFQDEWTDYIQRRIKFGKSEDGLEDTIWSCAFLQFWKAITAILDEPSRFAKKNQVYVGRIKALELSAEDRKLLGELLTVRNDFDVSHRAYDRFARALPRRNARVAQHVASKVILAYEGRLREGKPPFGPHPMRVYRLRKTKRSPLKDLSNLPDRRIARFTVGVDNLDFRAGPRLTIGAGRDIITWRFPTRQAKHGPEPK